MPNVYQERFFGLEQLTFNAGNDQYQFVDTTGTRIVFNGFAVQNPANLTQGMYQRGAMKSVTDADGNAITVTQYDTLGQHDPGDAKATTFSPTPTRRRATPPSCSPA